VVSGTWEERVDLGQKRAAALRGENIDDVVIDLLLDPVDTAVTFRTAIALLERRDLLGVKHVIRACACGDQNANDWLGDAFRHFRADSMGADDEFLQSALAGIASGADESDATAAREMSSWLFSS
jgi:hypothetical protein